MSFVKENVEWNEYYIHRIVYDQDVVNTPKIHEYNGEKKTMTMRKIPQMCIADMYGDKEKDLPPDLWKVIRDILVKLREIGVNYPDITPYNFIKCGDLVWIIDYGHASIRNGETDKFMLKFINGHNGWNEDFR
jgi:tRNA A-37 threonylcarbamoyl transferase component Bud32